MTQAELQPQPHPEPQPQPPLGESLILDTLRQVIDPELDCNIVDLGLVHGVEIHGRTVVVRMTLTTPGCPMHESIGGGVQAALLNLEGVDDVKVEWVWDPPWTPARISQPGRARAGLGPN